MKKLNEKHILKIVDKIYDKYSYFMDKDTIIEVVISFFDNGGKLKVEDNIDISLNLEKYVDKQIKKIIDEQLEQDNIDIVSKILNILIPEQIYNPLEILDEIVKYDINLSINNCVRLLDENDKLANLINLIKEEKLLKAKDINNNYIIKNIMRASSLLETDDVLDTSYVNTSLSRYESELAKYPVLTQEEEYNLAMLNLSGNKEARSKLIKHNLRLVISIASKYISSNVSLDDLVQEGTIGLMRAIEKYDPSKGRLSTYATPWIHQIIRRAIGNTESTVRVPIWLRDEVMKTNKAKAYLQNVLKRNPTNEEIAAYLNIEPKKIKELVLSLPNIISLNSPVNEDSDDNNAELMDIIANTSDDIIDYMDKKEFNKQFNDLLERLLDDREYEIIAYRYGYKTGRPEILEDVSRRFGISRERIRQIEQRALTKLRNNLDIRALREIINGNIVTTKGNNKILYTRDSIYQEFPNYNRVEIDKIINMLNPKEQCLLHLKFGDDFDNPSQNLLWSDDHELEYRDCIYPKMIYLLEKCRSNDLSLLVDNYDSIDDILHHKILNGEAPFTYQDKVRLGKIYENTNFQQLLTKYDDKCKKIIHYRFGINFKRAYSLPIIARKLGMDPNEVYELLSEFISAYLTLDSGTKTKLLYK